MSTFKSYPTRVETGVEWLGKAPQHWAILPGLALMTESRAKNTNAACQDYLSLVAGRGVIPYAEKGDVGNKKPDDLAKCKLVSPGNMSSIA